jgi:hypothetical protein
MPFKYKITETTAETGVTIERDANAEEVAQFEADEAAAAEAVTAAALKVEAKAGLLARLGITAEEAELLLS